MSRPEDLEYPDELALLSHRLQNKRYKKEDLKMAGKMVGLRITAEKTKLIKVMSAHEGGVGISQEMIEEVESFRYLGRRCG